VAGRTPHDFNRRKFCSIRQFAKARQIGLPEAGGQRRELGEPRGMVNRLEKQVTEEKPQVKRRIAVVRCFEIDEHDSVAGDQNVFGTEVGMDEAQRQPEHFGDEAFDVRRGFGIGRGDAPIKRIDAQLHEDFGVSKLRRKFWLVCGVAVNVGKIRTQTPGNRGVRAAFEK
jgi:hypothetical protein